MDQDRRSFLSFGAAWVHRDGNNLNTVANFSCCENLLMTQSTIVLI